MFLRPGETAESQSDKDILRDANRSHGVYQIYGAHTVYGTDVLLYIGRTRSQTFADRLSAHAKIYAESDDITVYVGQLAGTGAEDDTPPRKGRRERLIDMAEKLLIFFHGPAFNAQNINTLFDGKNPTAEELKREMVRVRNYGKYHSLIPEMSSDYMHDHEVNDKNVRKNGFVPYLYER